MQRLFATLFAVTCLIIGSTPSFARMGGPGIARGAGIGISQGAGAGIGRRGGIGIRRGAGVRQMTPRLNAIPAPLAEPAQAPIINGPLTPNGLPSMGNGLQ
jgi:hypothetical protein